MYIYMYVYAYVGVNIYGCMYMYVYICIFKYMYVQVCACVCIRIRLYNRRPFLCVSSGGSSPFGLGEDHMRIGTRRGVQVNCRGQKSHSWLKGALCA